MGGKCFLSSTKDRILAEAAKPRPHVTRRVIEVPEGSLYMGAWDISQSPDYTIYGRRLSNRSKPEWLW